MVNDLYKFNQEYIKYTVEEEKCSDRDLSEQNEIMGDNMKYYLFDFDGTLVDSMPAYVKAMLDLLDESNIEYDNDIIKTITPLGFLGTAKYFREIGVNLTIEEMAQKMDEYAIEAYTYYIPAKKNVIEVLKQLKEEGAHLNILTASPHITLKPCLKRLGIYDMFENVWSCDDFGTTKADPEIYKKAAEKIGAPIEKILFLDDNYHADKTAKEAGMKVCGVYDESSKDSTDEIKAVSDFYINDFIELLNIEF